MRTEIKKTTLVFLVSLALLILISILNWGVVSSWGRVKVSRINVIGDDGLKYSALMYVPKTATDENPAPAIIMFHGASGNARNHESWSVEFSRRGYVCLSIDWSGAGESDYNSTAKAKVGIPDLFMKYLFDCPVVDNTQIITAGHSMGCSPTIAMAIKYQTAGALVMSGAKELKNQKQPFFGNQLASIGDSDQDSRETGHERLNTNGRLLGYIGEGEAVELGKVYGSFEEGNAHLYLMQEGQIHEGVFVNDGVIKSMIDFCQKAFKTPNPIDANKTVWVWKDFLGLAGMLVFAFTMISFALMLIDTIPFFAEVKQPLPRNIGLRKFGLILSVVIAIAGPIICMKTGTFGLQQKLGMQEVAFFSMGRANNATSLVLGTSLFGIVMLGVFWFTDGRKQKANLRDLGLTTEDMPTRFNFRLVGKAFLLAFLAIAAGWTYLGIQTDVLGTDFYCQFFGYKPIAEQKFIHYLPYILTYIVAFIISALGMNVERRLPSTGKEKLDTAIAVLVNIFLANIAIVVICLIQNRLQLSQGGFMTGQMMSSWKIDVTRLWGMPVGMAIGAGGSTYCYRKTGNIWLGAFLMGTVCALGCVLYGQYTLPV